MRRVLGVDGDEIKPGGPENLHHGRVAECRLGSQARLATGETGAKRTGLLQLDLHTVPFLVDVRDNRAGGYRGVGGNHMPKHALDLSENLLSSLVGLDFAQRLVDNDVRSVSR